MLAISIYLSVYLSINQSIYLSIYIYIYIAISRIGAVLHSTLVFDNNLFASVSRSYPQNYLQTITKILIRQAHWQSTLILPELVHGKFHWTPPIFDGQNIVSCKFPHWVHRSKINATKKFVPLARWPSALRLFEEMVRPVFLLCWWVWVESYGMVLPILELVFSCCSCFPILGGRQQLTGTLSNQGKQLNYPLVI